jgi:hypothetical protein
VRLLGHADLHECLLGIGLVHIPEEAEVLVAAIPGCRRIIGEGWAN